MTDFHKPRKFGPASRSSRYARPGADRPRFEMHQATCNKCGETCEVPFRPNGKKPVYCRNCFVRDDAQPESRGFEKHGFDSRRPSARPAADAADPRLYAIQKELSVVHAKLDELIALLEADA